MCPGSALHRPLGLDRADRQRGGAPDDPGLVVEFDREHAL
jgi:hypothetical protein